MSDSKGQSLGYKRKSTEFDSLGSSYSDDSNEKSNCKKRKKYSSEKKKKKKEKRKGKKMKKDKDREKKRKVKKSKRDSRKRSTDDEGDIGPVMPSDLIVHEEQATSRNFAPMSKEAWEAKQKEVRRVLDEESGRYRLIRGDGEVLEEIVSREKHREINRQATLGDGQYFQTVMSRNKSL